MRTSDIQPLALAATVLVSTSCDPVRSTRQPEPDVAHLVFNTFDTASGSWGVATSDADGGERRDVPLQVQNPDDYPDVAFHNVRWSPDGRRISYRASNTNTDNWYLVLSDAQGSMKRRLTPLGGYMDDPRWSPRGDRLLYHWGGFVGGRAGQTIQTAFVDTLGNSTDFFVDGDGDMFEGERVYFGLLPVADSSGFVPALYDAAWAADGDHLLLVGTIGKRAWDADLQVEDVEVFRISIATRRVVERVTRNNVPEWGFKVAPDERHILLRVWHETSAWYPQEGGFYMPLTGMAADLVRIAEAPAGLKPMEWATDSRHVTFTRDVGPGGYPGIFVYDLATRTERATAAFGYWPHLHVPDE